MRILYLGLRSGTSWHRFCALQRLGHSVDLVDPRPPTLAGRIGQRWTHVSGSAGVSPLVRRHLADAIGKNRYDLALVDGGELLGPGTVRWLRTVSDRVINFNQDNPYEGDEGRKWRLFLRAVPEYDLIVTPRASSVAKAGAAGARRVLEVTFAADEIVHRPPAEEDGPVVASDVCFAGTWRPERGPFMLRLIEKGVPLRIFGPRWRKAAEFPLLSAHLDDRSLDDRDYVAVIAGAKIALALVSAGNHDLHTTRSLEIPAIGALICAERTSDHMAMYRDGEEAVFWSDADECADLCLALLADPARIARIARAGHARAHRNASFNEPILAKMIATATEAR